MVAQCANKIWDIHPIMPIVRASGAIVTTWDNKNPVMVEILLFLTISLIIIKF